LVKDRLFEGIVESPGNNTDDTPEELLLEEEVEQEVVFEVEEEVELELAVLLVLLLLPLSP
jgi:hypothetical protein